MSEYDKQAADFLESTGTKLEVTFLYNGPYFSDDEENRGVYAFTLQNAKGIYSAKFGDSIQNSERRALVTGKTRGHGFNSYSGLMPADARLAKKLGFKVSRHGRLSSKEVQAARTHKPGAYDILACLGSYYPETFTDFCSEFGYDDQSLDQYPKVMAVFTQCKEEERGLNSLFTAEELERLAEIA